MPTNHLGQQTTDSGHVITESERIAKAVRSLFEKATMSENDGAVDTDLTLFDTDELIKDIAAYVMDYAHTEWSKNVRHGVALGRSDAVAMLQSVLRPSTIDVPASEIKKIITALEETA